MVNLVLAVINDSFSNAIENRRSDNSEEIMTLRKGKQTPLVTKLEDDENLRAKTDQLMDKEIAKISVWNKVFNKNENLLEKIKQMKSEQSDDKNKIENEEKKPEIKMNVGKNLNILPRSDTADTHHEDKKVQGFSADKEKKNIDLTSTPRLEDNNQVPSIGIMKKKSAHSLKLNALWYVIMFKSRFNLAAIRYKIKRRARGNFLSKACFDIIGSIWFLYTTTFIIILNTIVLSLDRYPIKASEDEFFDKVNIFFTSVLCFELILKLIGKKIYSYIILYYSLSPKGLGIKEYFLDQINIYDLIITLCNVIEILLSSFNTDKDSYAFLTAIKCFRAIRIFRMFKLAKTWTGFRNLLKALHSSLVEILWFTLLVFLFMIVFSLLGMELFAYKAFFNPNGSLADPKYLLY